MRRVVVTGLGIVSSIGTGAEEVTASLREAKSGVQHAPDHAAHGFRSQVWAPPSMGATAEDWADKVDRRAARFLANGTAWAHIAFEEALKDSGLSADEIKEQAKTLSGGGIDYLYDPVGGEVGETCLRALGDDGQHLVIGFVAGIPKLPANQVLLRNRRITGVDWGGWAGKNPERNNAMLAEVMTLIARGELRPVEPVAYPLERAADALRDLEDRKVAGKIALIP